MAESSITTAGIACAEAVSLLHLLHNVPAQPSVNSSRPPEESRHGSYSLPFAIERSLASTFAFLSSVNDNPKRISAVCVHENPVTKALNVLVAVNQIRYKDGATTLQCIKNGLEGVVSSLPNGNQG